MDQEAIRLVGPLIVGLIAGLGGAGITAGINRKNTKETFEDTRNREHVAWLRDRKQEAYVDFLVKSNDIIQGIKDGHNARELRTELDRLDVVLGRITMVASTDVLSTGSERWTDA
ncbi:hypothetical protein [Arthrobacter celericrescens]|uniref:hypothetical protein n=1 Tax=Arthrobacter celericrescens TaxID=2320851 RepID=UPI000EA05F50|nr:hypothetical protein [Arthrobacter celericrescens]